ncbi:hypothetical protein [Tardiphaga sp.]|jgi:hypothetical protein|uniref:hypothetical protein n=1 Tax=Tardiphaga sp. TaxID=1926292 RepID=UPI0037DA1094
MSRGAQVYRQTDATKLMRAVRKAGLEIERVEVDQSGKIIVIPKPADDRSADVASSVA